MTVIVLFYLGEQEHELHQGSVSSSAETEYTYMLSVERDISKVWMLKMIGLNCSTTSWVNIYFSVTVVTNFWGCSLTSGLARRRPVSLATSFPARARYTVSATTRSWTQSASARPLTAYAKASYMGEEIRIG